MVKCHKCGTENEKAAVYCENCGMKLPKFSGKITGNVLADTLIWIVIVLVVCGILVNWVLGPIFGLLAS